MRRRAPSIPMPACADEPRALWALKGLPDTTAHNLERWIDALATLPIDAWLRAGNRCVQRDHTALTITRACGRVEKAIAAHELAVTAWFIRDMVETATWRVRRAAVRRPSRVRAELAVARMAAEWAALAIATQSWLDAADLDALLGPFERPGSVIESAPAERLAVVAE